MRHIPTSCHLVFCGHYPTLQNPKHACVKLNMYCACANANFLRVNVSTYMTSSSSSSRMSLHQCQHKFYLPCTLTPKNSIFLVLLTVHLSITLVINPLKPNNRYRGRTVPLTSKRCILYIYSTNIGTECFQHGVYSPFLPLHNAVCFRILAYLVPVLFTFYIQVCAKIKKK